MIEIAAANENAIVSVSVSHQIGNGVDREGCPGSRRSDRTLSPPPSLETLSISTSSSSTTNNGNCIYDGDEINDNDNDNDNGSEFNDCSSSVSSQDSSNIVYCTTRTPPKRLVFSQYWQKTGQKPIPFRGVKSPSNSALSGRSPYTLPPQTSSLTAATLDASTSISSTTPSMSPFNSSSSLFSIDRLLNKSMSNADLLEDDGNCSCPNTETEGSALKATQLLESQSLSRTQTQTQTPSQTPARRPRRRSILPPAPMSHPALKSTVTHATRSWRKSVSLSNVGGCYARNRELIATNKTRSLPRLPSSSVLLPGNSCLRPHQKYSPSKKNLANIDTDTVTVNADFGNIPISRKPESTTRQCSTLTSSSSTTTTMQFPGLLTRSDSASSSVSFLEAVDVRHFEPPRETYSGKGWSDYFK